MRALPWPMVQVFSVGVKAIIFSRCIWHDGTATYMISNNIENNLSWSHVWFGFKWQLYVMLYPFVEEVEGSSDGDATAKKWFIQNKKGCIKNTYIVCTNPVRVPFSSHFFAGILGCIVGMVVTCLFSGDLNLRSSTSPIWGRERATKPAMFQKGLVSPPRNNLLKEVPETKIDMQWTNIPKFGQIIRNMFRTKCYKKYALPTAEGHIDMVKAIIIFFVMCLQPNLACPNLHCSLRHHERPFHGKISVTGSFLNANTS